MAGAQLAHGTRAIHKRISCRTWAQSSSKQINIYDLYVTRKKSQNGYFGMYVNGEIRFLLP